jgi:uncharacterized protein YqjF (DUF2071 family)
LTSSRGGVNNHDFNSGILQQVAHRPWPLPDRPWVMTQTWHDLLFAHWPVPQSTLRPLVPAALELDLFEGAGWISVVPFYMTNVAPRWLPSLPWVSAFPELNVRTYVRAGGRAGIYFFSLDAGNALAVQVARTFLNLPYHSASMTADRTTAEVKYRSARRSDPGIRFEAAYQPAGPAFVAGEGSLEHFLTERYCLYHLDHQGAPYRLEIHHPPWPLQPATATLVHNTLADVIGVRLAGRPPLLQFAKRQDVVAWMPESLR